MKKAIALLCVAFFCGCGILYTNEEQPYSYRSATPIDVKAAPSDPVVQGRACNRSVLFLVSWGDGGYAGAVRQALKGNPDATLYDVKADVQVKAYLIGLYLQSCTLVTGKVGHP